MKFAVYNNVFYLKCVRHGGAPMPVQQAADQKRRDEAEHSASQTGRASLPEHIVANVNFYHRDNRTYKIAGVSEHVELYGQEEIQAQKSSSTEKIIAIQKLKTLSLTLMTGDIPQEHSLIEKFKALNIQSLQELRLDASETQLTKSQYEKLAGFLKLNPKLKKLSLDLSNHRNQAEASFAVNGIKLQILAFKDLRHLEHLSIALNHFKSDANMHTIFCCLAKNLSYLRGLKSLSLDFNSSNVSMASADVIFDGINQHLEQLASISINISDEFSENNKLASVIKNIGKLQTINTLRISYFSDSPEEYLPLAGPLLALKKLKKLELNQGNTDYLFYGKSHNKFIDQLLELEKRGVHVLHNGNHPEHVKSTWCQLF